MLSSLKKYLPRHSKKENQYPRNRVSGFTLVELLIVVGILVTISTAAVMVINPAELIKQSNDSKRLSDLAALDKSLSLYRVDTAGVLASTSTVYLSLPDTSATCASYPTLPTLASPYVYHCSTAATAPNMDGTGWIPVNLSNLSGGTPLSHLPQDPMNTASYYDAFIPGSDGSYVLTTKLESQKYLTKATADGGYDATRAETGSPVLWATATNLLDVTNPTVSTFSPADNATNASISADFTITFAEAVQVGTGNITLKKTDGTLVEAMSVTDPFRVSGSGSTTITINPTANLAYSTGYYVLIDATAFDDLAGNSYAGIADSSTWNFTTGAAPDVAINIAAIAGVTAPVRAATPVTTVTETAQYTGTVTWSPTDNPFAASTVYTATITLTPKFGYTVTGVSANFFTVAGATSATNPANSGVVTAVFPATCPSTVTDARDGKTYAVVSIGTQCWMAQNLNVGTTIPVTTTMTNNGTIEKYCYANTASNCTAYGGLYQWDEVMQYVASCNGTGAGQPACSSPVQGICPTGWHVPSHYEWTYLLKQVGSNPEAFPYDTATGTWIGTDEGSNLKEAGTSHWASGNTGTNSSGFTAVGGGGCSVDGYCGSKTGWSYMWSSTQTPSDTSKSLLTYLEYAHATVLRWSDAKITELSVRCIKN